MVRIITNITYCSSLFQCIQINFNNVSHIYPKITFQSLRSFIGVLIDSESSLLRINSQNLYWYGISSTSSVLSICTFFVFNIDFTANAFSLNTCTLYTQDSHHFCLLLKFKSGKRNKKLFHEFNLNVWKLNIRSLKLHNNLNPTVK